MQEMSSVSVTAQWAHFQQLRVITVRGTAVRVSGSESSPSLGMEGLLKTRKVLTTKKMYFITSKKLHL